MKKITIGQYVRGSGIGGGGPACHLDVDVLLESRLLLMANSGMGKSRGLRRFIEQAAGQVQQIVVDLEGEFPSLREKFDFVLAAAAGAGGDVDAHPRTAEILARRLRETRVSCIVDLSELKAHLRHEFARRFFDGLIEAPRSLWNPCLVVVDETQVFAPEKGQGESEASGAVVDLATRGRKRGLCLIASTQRPSTLLKSVSAELKNRMIGRHHRRQ